jgi:hypothetical protein
MTDTAPLKAAVDPTELKQWIIDLLPRICQKTRSARHSGPKSLLGVLLFEAHRRQLYRGWGSRSLGAFVANQGVRARTFQKYRTAGQRLLEYCPQLHAQTIDALANGTDVPALPTPSKLAMLPKPVPGVEMAPHFQQMLMNPRVHANHVKWMADGARYKWAAGSDRELLRTIDEVGERLALIDSLVAAQASHRPPRNKDSAEAVRGRLAQLRASGERARQLADKLEAALPPPDQT